MIEVLKKKKITVTLIKDSLADFMEDHGHAHRTAAMGFYISERTGLGSKYILHK